MSFHSGERTIQRRAGVEDDALAVGRTIGRALTPPVARFLARQRLAVAASLDENGRVWASLLTGPAGFLQPIDTENLRVATDPPAGDPLAANLATRPDVGLLVIDPRTRQRMRLSGRATPGAPGFTLHLREVYGNCPKYIQRREAVPDVSPRPAAPRVTPSLDETQRDWIGRADTLFIASFHPQGGADASHRGGRPGFVRVLNARRLTFPDFPGNAMFQTLGNLSEYPPVGLLFVDFETGDVLQLTGRASVGSDFAVTVDVDEVRDTRAASPLRFRLVEYSPAIPD